MFRWVRRLLCRHDGQVWHVHDGTIAGVRFILWRCARCGADVFDVDES